MIPGVSARRLVARHAEEKAKSCLALISNGTILSADTVVFCEGKIIGKPKNLEDAVRILSKLQGRWHEVYTGVTLLRVEKGTAFAQKNIVVKTGIRIRPMSRHAILNYFRRVNPLDKAGAYAIQSRSQSIVEKVRGSFSNAVGLPMEKLLLFLRKNPSYR
jgi:MAF protein